MKKLSFFVSAFALCASTSYAAINCGTLPTCSDLGYTDKVAECPSSSEVLKCPFDTTYGKCTRGPSIGDLKYSLNTTNHNGWILCNGQSLNKTTYSALFTLIGTNYGEDGTKFRVPDYRGFFLRAYGTATNNNSLSSFGGSANSSLTAPQKEQLPNITGRFSGVGENNNTLVGAFYKYNTTSKPAEGAPVRNQDGDKDDVFGFDASRPAGSVYQNGGHVIPANYAANIFIYAGR